MQPGVRTRASHTPRTLSAGARRRLDPCIPESRMHRDPLSSPFPRCRRRPLKTDGSHPLNEPSVFFMRGKSRGHEAYPKHRLPFLIFDCI